MFVGFLRGTWYEIYMPETGKMMVPRDVDFEEGTERRENERNTIEVGNGNHDIVDDQFEGVSRLSENLQKKLNTNADIPGSPSDDNAEEEGKDLDEDEVQ